MSQCVLIVDDLASVRLYHSTFLKRKGYECIGATDGFDALAKLKENKVGLILLDLSMPNMTGQEFIEKVRSLPSCAQIPIILITSETSRESLNQMGLGSFTVITKPVLPEILLQTVQNMLMPTAT